MISAEQKLEIEKYLISKKLPIDILLEVKDHIISQVEEIKKDENLEFHLAFDSVKNAWQDELEMKSNYFLNIKAPNFVYRIMVESDKKVLKKSLCIVLIIQLLMAIFILKISNKEQFNWFYLIINLSLFIIPISIFVFNFRNLNFFKIKKRTLQYSIYQRNLTDYIAFITFLNSTIFDSSKSSERIFNLFHGQDLSSKSSWILFVLIFIMQTMMVFTNINLFQHSKTVNHIRKYIPNYK